MFFNAVLSLVLFGRDKRAALAFALGSQSTPRRRS